MISKKYKIPYVFLDTDPTNEAKILYNRIVNILKERRIPYVSKNGDKIYVITDNKNIELKNIEEITYISNILIIPQCKYSTVAKNLVDIYLNSGLDILCFPSSILNHGAIFSNNLIRDGAICITSEYMLLEYLININ